MKLMNMVHTHQQPLDSRQLRAFVTLAKTGSFTRTGKELFISQSAVSHSMKALESDIGCRLFDRVGKRAHLTPAGEHLLHHAEKILREMSVARESLEQLGKWGKGRLRIGASPTVCQYILPTVMREFKKDFPDWLIAIEPVDSYEAGELLREGRIDIAVGLAPQRADPVEFLPLFSDELVFLLAVDHPWVLQGRVIREEIPRQNFILYSKTSYTFQMVEQYFQREGMTLKLFIELGSMDAIKELVKLGLGISILAPWVVRQDLADKTVAALSLGKRKLKRSWGILRPVNRRPNLAEETFVKHCRAFTAKLSDVVEVSEEKEFKTEE